MPGIHPIKSIDYQYHNLKSIEYQYHNLKSISKLLKIQMI